MKKFLSFPASGVLLITMVLFSFSPVWGANDEAPTIDLKNLKEFSDLRGVVLKMKNIDLSNADWKDKYDVLLTADFDSETSWPSKDRLPPNFNPQEIIAIGKKPGLGVEDLHKESLTGKGVRVAIIDQPLLLGHQEYKDKIASYVPIDCRDVEPQMHGAAVSSLLVGETCGTAPGASLYFWAEPSWKLDYAMRTAALRQIIEFNKGKPSGEKIKVVSVSIGFNPDYKNFEDWKKALEEAQKSGLIVVHCDGCIFGIGCTLFKDVNDPANYEICHFAKARKDKMPAGFLYVPIDNRTYANFKNEKGYTFGAKGGLSWGAPYLAGIIALGFQVDPELTEEKVFTLLKKGGTPFNEGFIVNPKKFIQLVKEAKK